MLADDCLLTDRSGLPRCRPLLRIVMDSQLRLPLDSKMVAQRARRSAGGHHLGLLRRAAQGRWRAAASRCWCFDGPGGRADLRGVIEWLGREEVSIADDRGGQQSELDGARSGRRGRIFFYYAPKILGGLESLPLAGGIGRRRRADAIRMHNVTIHPIPPDEFAVEGYVGCSPGLLKNWARWKRSNAGRRRAPDSALRHGNVRIMTEAPASPSTASASRRWIYAPDRSRADLAPETLRRSNLGDLRPGSRVNLERPLSPTGRLSGHIVQGHVDGTGEFWPWKRSATENWWLRMRVPAELDPFLVFKGSIAIDGISLTIAALEADVLSVTIIPHTYRNTTLGGYRPGARLNLECDILAKHVEKLMRKLDFKKGLTVEKLKENGY